jgi:hypothetical protein
MIRKSGYRFSEKHALGLDPIVCTHLAKRTADHGEERAPTPTLPRKRARKRERERAVRNG